MVVERLVNRRASTQTTEHDSADFSIGRGIYAVSSESVRNASRDTLVSGSPQHRGEQSYATSLCISRW